MTKLRLPAPFCSMNSARRRRLSGASRLASLRSDLCISKCRTTWLTAKFRYRLSRTMKDAIGARNALHSGWLFLCKNCPGLRTTFSRPARRFGRWQRKSNTIISHPVREATPQLVGPENSTARLTCHHSAFRYVQTFVRFRHDMIDHRFHIFCAFECGKLSICAGAFAHDALDVRHLAVSAEFVCLACHKFEQLV